MYVKKALKIKIFTRISIIHSEQSPHNISMSKIYTNKKYLSQTTCLPKHAIHNTLNAIHNYLFLKYNLLFYVEYLNKSFL
jgi:hypothetical protein